MARLLQMPPDCVPTTYDLVVKITLPGLNSFQMGSSTELQADLSCDDTGHSCLSASVSPFCPSCRTLGGTTIESVRVADS